jgi:hypothetical protein
LMILLSQVASLWKRDVGANPVTRRVSGETHYA